MFIALSHGSKSFVNAALAETKENHKLGKFHPFLVVYLRFQHFPNYIHHTPMFRFHGVGYLW